MTDSGIDFLLFLAVSVYSVWYSRWCARIPDPCNLPLQKPSPIADKGCIWDIWNWILRNRTIRIPRYYWRRLFIHIERIRLSSLEERTMNFVDNWSMLTYNAMRNEAKQSTGIPHRTILQAEYVHCLHCTVQSSTVQCTSIHYWSAVQHNTLTHHTSIMFLGSNLNTSPRVLLCEWVISITHSLVSCCMKSMVRRS